MKYNFDQINNRRNTNSLKWDIGEHEFPMWVADMDFQTAPAVTQAIQKRAESGIFGYNIVPDNWYDAITGWWEKRHQTHFQKEWLIFCTGVIPAITTAVQRLTNVGDNVVIQTPVYDIFFHSVENHGRHVLENALHYDEQTHEYSMDFEDLEEKLADPLTTMMILCNPQNPVGKIWTKEELVRIGNLCKKYHVTVVADEIHCDITEPGKSYVPFISVNEECRENCVTCISATKAFNIAGLQSSAVVIPDEMLRQKMERGLNSNEVAEPNCFAIDSVIAAFTQGEEWLEELREYISGNRKLVAEYLEKEVPEISLVKGDCTYLLWIDCSGVTKNVDELCQFIRSKTGLYLTAGSQYRGVSKAFIRMNVACPRVQVEHSLGLFKDGIIGFMHQ